jgi:DNA-binding MarR family transcriptional regulator
VQRAIEEAGFDDFRITHMNVFAWLPDSGARIGELARQAQLSKQTMTELVSYLERRGYVSRTRDPTDGRAWIVRLTKRGLALDRVARNALRDTEAEWARMLGQRAYLQLRKQLQRLLVVAEASSQPPRTSLADLSDRRASMPARRESGRGRRP